ncbi:hypothetical protein AGMMS50262_05180 [Bacteroidia bacterium]|nr:hypothetical protein AGMMS50262_05180 [Bacteroidia bacterium]
MNKALNELLIAKILECVPFNVKPIDYLVNLLGISSESAYRKMRNEIFFSLEEMDILANHLNFLTNSIIGNYIRERLYFNQQTDVSLSAGKNFLIMMEEYGEFIGQVAAFKETETMASINRISLFQLIQSESLFKFFYFNWIHQNDDPMNVPFSELQISEDILAAREKLISYVNIFNNCNYIVDRNMFLSFVKEIQYYHDKNLISDDEVLLLKQELVDLLHSFEKFLKKGENDAGTVYDVYLSPLDVEINTAFADFGNQNVVSHFWLYSVNSVFLRNQGLCFVHKKWLDLLKKSSIHITKENEAVRAEFLNKQREYIEMITEKLSLYH